ncbi:S24 family peptidase [Ruegeria atlantica]|uniref:S24 family peptidase n=1 Tax=Ruegeria atlantica TaxID=81569 RepID=UPI0014807E67|nr:S24 family peptidase [Ruegeria atlantica]
MSERLTGTEFLKSLINNAIKKKNISLHNAEVGHGLPRGSIRNVLDGHDPRFSRAVEICEALGIEFQIGPPRSAAEGDAPDVSSPGESSNVVPLERVPKSVSDLLGLPEGVSADEVWRVMQAKIPTQGIANASSADALERRMERAYKIETRNLLDRLDELVVRLPAPKPPEVRRFKMRAVGGLDGALFRDAGLGTALIAADDVPSDLDPSLTVAIRAGGLAMEPTIQSDYLLVLNLAATQPREGAIFMIVSDSNLVVRRLRRKAGAWIMTNDGNEEQAGSLADNTRIVGRVVWFGPEGAVVVDG